MLLSWLVGISYSLGMMLSIAMGRLLPSFLIPLLLFNLLLPCFTMEHAGNHAHAVTLRAVHAHGHIQPASPAPSADPQDQKRDAWCHGNLLVAFYGKSDTGTSVLSVAVSRKAPVNDLLSPVDVYPFTGDRVGYPQTFPRRLLACLLYPSSLCRQKTAFLL